MKLLRIFQPMNLSRDGAAAASLSVNLTLHHFERSPHGAPSTSTSRFKLKNGELAAVAANHNEILKKDKE
jgi:hypothetical protein